MKIYEPEVVTKYGMITYYDYQEALEVARKLKKPLLLDFTGVNCVNCRKMEESVWPDPRVLKRLNEDYVLVSLYVDDRTNLSEDEQYVSSFSGKRINTVGRKWSDLQQSRFGVNAQPYYVVTDTDGNQLIPASAYDEDIEKYVNFLDEGLKAFASAK